MATNLCTVQVDVSPSGAGACDAIEANWTILETIRLFLCCLQTNSFFKTHLLKRFVFENQSSAVRAFSVPAEYSVCLGDTVPGAVQTDEIMVYLNGVLQHHTTDVLDTSPASTGKINITFVDPTVTITLGGEIADETLIVFVPVCIALDC